MMAIIFLESGELGYQCALQFKNTEFSYCGAALIDPLGTSKPEYVITAAHCVKDRLINITYKICTTFLNVSKLNKNYVLPGNHNQINNEICYFMTLQDSRYYSSCLWSIENVRSNGE